MNTTQYIITIKLPNNPDHNPQHKIPGKCPAFGGYCTDTTGAHHTTVADFFSADIAEEYYRSMGFHVTRIERFPSDVEH